MKTFSQPKLSLAALLFAAGMVVGVGLSVVAAWADLEAAYYGFPNLASASFNGLRCPILMAKDGTETVAVTISNPAKREISPIVAVRISTPALPERDSISIDIAPGESRRLEWAISSENVDLYKFVFVYALVYSSYPIPDKEATCGVFVVDAPVSGRTILIGAVALYALLTGIGLFLLTRSGLPRKKLQPFIFLAGATFLLLVLSLIGNWIFAAMLLTVTILAVVVVAAFWVQD